MAYRQASQFHGFGRNISEKWKVTLLNKNGNLMKNASACLSLDGTLSNIFAMKLLVQNQTRDLLQYVSSQLCPYPSPVIVSKETGILLPEGPQIKQGNIQIHSQFTDQWKKGSWVMLWVSGFSSVVNSPGWSGRLQIWDRISRSPD